MAHPGEIILPSNEFYTDYRKFLQDWLSAQRNRNHHFSYRYFCSRAGTKSPSLLQEVISGKRNLTSRTVEAFVKGLGLKAGDAEYFRVLVSFCQSKDEEHKRDLLARMRGMKRRVQQKIIPPDLFEYYSQWYYPVLRELAPCSNWGGDFAVLARSLSPRIKTSEARKGVELLLQLGFLRMNSDGTFSQSDPDISTGEEVASLAVREINRQYAALGKDALDLYPPSKRNITTVVMGIPQSVYPKLVEEIVEFRKRVIRMVSEVDKTESVYNLLIELFPLSTPYVEGGTNDVHK